MGTTYTTCHTHGKQEQSGDYNYIKRRRTHERERDSRGMERAPDENGDRAAEERWKKKNEGRDECHHLEFFHALQAKPCPRPPFI